MHDSVAGYLGIVGKSVKTLNGVEKKTMQRPGPVNRETPLIDCIAALGNPNKVGGRELSMSF